MQDPINELKDALAAGFVPKEIKDFMDANGHEGQVWAVEPQEYDRQVQTGEDENGNPVYVTEKGQRVGVGYKIANADGGEESHVIWYDENEVQELLKEYNGGQNS